jgi:putative molybdopterin biosynthesis protein
MIRSDMQGELFNTQEVADYLRLKERTIYELVRTRQIPCSRVTGKLLFPRHLIDLWVTRQLDFAGPELSRAPAVVAGSHDPLLEWAVRMSGSDLALLTGGSADGLQRLAAGKAMLAGLHILDQASGEYNVAAVRSGRDLADLVLIEWAMREQGMVVAEGNPHGIAAPADLAKPGVRLVRRQEGASSQTLLRHILEAANIRLERVTVMVPPAVTESEVAAAILDGKADAGIAVRAVAHHCRLDFVPLRWERFDLAVRRRDYFEPPVQKLLSFARSAEFTEKAAVLGGYDIARTGSVSYNA